MTSYSDGSSLQGSHGFLWRVLILMFVHVCVTMHMSLTKHVDRILVHAVLWYCLMDCQLPVHEQSVEVT